MGKPTFDLCYSEEAAVEFESWGTPGARGKRASTGLLSPCEGGDVGRELGVGEFGSGSGVVLFGLAEIKRRYLFLNSIGNKSEPGELKHLSTRRKGHQRDSVSSGERTRIRPMLLSG
jgi:hypothetical protein